MAEAVSVVASRNPANFSLCFFLAISKRVTDWASENLANPDRQVAGFRRIVHPPLRNRDPANAGRDGPKSVSFPDVEIPFVGRDTTRIARAAPFIISYFFLILIVAMSSARPERK